MAPPRRSGSRPGRVLAVLAVVIVAMLAGILGGQIGNPGKWQHQFRVGLGLDLSSGTQVVLRAYAPGGKQPTASAMNQAISILEARVNGTGTSGASVQQQGSNQINVSVPGQAEQQVINEVSNTSRLAFRPVLLWQPAQAAKPGAGATPSPSPSGTASPKGASPSPSASGTPTAKTKALIVHDGATPPAPAQGGAPAAPAQGGVPSAPAAPNAGVPSGTAHQSGTTPNSAATPAASGAAAPTSATGPFGAPTKVDPAVKKLFDKMVCKPGPNANTVNESWKATVGYTNQKSQWDNPSSQIVSCDPQGDKYVLDKTIFDGTDVTQVQPSLGQNSTSWVVNINLNGRASKAFGDITTRQAQQYLPTATSNENNYVLAQNAVVLGGNVLEAPQTQAALTSGSFMINGGQTGFTEDQANNLANVVKYGQLPLNFQRQSANYVSPTLGHNSLVAGLIAGIIGLIVVLFYLFAYYRGLGLFVAVPSLIIAAALSYFGVVLLSAHAGFTMSLAAIAGLIVAIGITADSFIVYFERLRDEVRDGKQLRPAVESGWKRARRTILVSDTVSFLAAVLLYKFATSDVQGFAFTLGLTTLIDVVVVFLFTKPMMTVLAGRKFFRDGHPMSGLDPKRLGARAPWRSSVRRTQRSRADRLARTHQTSSSSTSTREA